MVLSDRALREAIASGRLNVTPLDETAIQPSSIDLRLGPVFQVFVNQTETHIDPRLNQPDLTKTVEVDEGASFVLHPGEFVLGGTVETIQMSDDLVGRIEGKSSLGRLGLMVHSTAGYVDPGFRGSLTLELSNHANLPILLWPGMRVSQLSVMQLTSPAERPYGSPGLDSKYQDQRGSTPSRSHLGFARRDVHTA
ncbi:MAG: dCTP deaminase [Chloroflexota bacterium]|nr:dCTP deaminase [Chloroflexota bacterium]